MRRGHLAMARSEWFVGFVVDVSSDPDKLGYIKVRIPLDDDNTSDEELPWAYPLLPVTSASFNGIGISPTGIEIESQVCGVFLDGETRNERLILGTIPAIRNNDLAKHDVSPLARGTNIIEKDVSGPEPQTTYNAVYPYNKVHTTKSGHVIEIDDSPAAERIHIYHRSGSYVELVPDGSIVTKSTKHNYSITQKDNFLHVEGDLKITVKGNVTLDVDGSMTSKIKDSFTLNSDSSITMKAPNITIERG